MVFNSRHAVSVLCVGVELALLFDGETTTKFKAIILQLKRK